MNTATKRNKLSTTTAKGGFNWNDGGQSLGAYYQYTNSPTHFKSRGTEDDNILGVETESIGELIDKHFTNLDTEFLGYLIGKISRISA